MSKKVIRKNCFETNSSSQHSIVVTKNDTHVTPQDLTAEYDEEGYNANEYIYLHNGKWSLWDLKDGFGWEFRILSSFEDKFKYAICAYLGWMEANDPKFDETWNRFREIAKEMIPGFVDFSLDYKEVDIYMDENGNELSRRDMIYQGRNEDSSRVYTYKDANGEEKPAILNTEYVYEIPNVGMIDHQSMGMLTGFLNKHNITLKEFLTNKRYIIITDNDNSCYSTSLWASGLVDKNNIVEGFDESGEDIEWEEWKKEHPDEGSDVNYNDEGK